MVLLLAVLCLAAAQCSSLSAFADSATKLLTLQETAEMTRTPVATLRYWRHLGTTGPRSFRVGRRVVYAESDVLRWLEQQYDQLTSPERRLERGRSRPRKRLPPDPRSPA